jgi:hypothetical protein
MDAPAKTGGSRKQRSGRDLIGRLTTLPPIQFLKRHNPLRRRRKVKLGFDQPRDEIQKLALPLRTTPPPLRRRVKLWAGRQWCKSAVVAGRLSVRTQRARAAARSIVDRASTRLIHIASLGVQRVVALKDTTAGRWCVSHVQALSRPLVAWWSLWYRRLAYAFTGVSPVPQWEPTQAPVLMARAQRVRRALVGMVVCEWMALAGLCATLAVLAIERHTWDTRAINLCGVILCALSLAGLVLHAWHQRLVASWRALDLFICGHCGELRNFSPSLPCPRCSNDAVPVFPGQVPDAWKKWSRVLSAPALAMPAIVSALLLFSSRVL